MTTVAEDRPMNSNIAALRVRVAMLRWAKRGTEITTIDSVCLREGWSGWGRRATDCGGLGSRRRPKRERLGTRRLGVRRVDQARGTLSFLLAV